MKHLSKFVGACLSAAVLTACGGSTRRLSPSLPMFAPPIASQQSAAVASAEITAAAGRNLYVANYASSTVSVYASGSTKLLRKSLPGRAQTASAGI